MLITLTCYCRNAPEVGYLLAKNPQSIFQREFSQGTVWVYYPEVAEDHLTVALLCEIDPIALVRGPAALQTSDHYVNDRPFVSSSLTSVALRTAFSTALSGRNKERPERLDERMRWVVTLPAVACDGGEDLITRLFSPLGYTLAIDRLPLDAHFSAWGPSDIFSIRLQGLQTVRDVLGHLYVLLPVLDNSKHYYVEQSETEKLLDHGRAWLPLHPERGLIAARYLRYKRPLIISLFTRLAILDTPTESEADTDVDAERGSESEAAVPAEPQEQQASGRLGLHEQRLQAALEAVREAKAKSLVDLGCGEGKLLQLALREKQLSRIVGMDVSSQALARARRRLHWETMAPAMRKRIEIFQGSLLYRDSRLAGFDVAALVEVIEHLDAARLGAMERVVFEHARPLRVVVTTPNREYNVHWEQLGAGEMRHEDHRFEWTRDECRTWAERVASTYGYRFARREVGPEDPESGAPSQMVIFDRG
jgi:3' terminal RNA ribose 2'-O-methyltransferase Hen1